VHSEEQLEEIRKSVESMRNVHQALIYKFCTLGMELFIVEFQGVQCLRATKLSRHKLLGSIPARFDFHITNVQGSHWEPDTLSRRVDMTQGFR